MPFIRPIPARYVGSRGVPVTLGPFKGGMNLYSDLSAISDNELADCINFEIEVDYTLKCRPPIYTVTDMSATWTERIVLLGVAVFSTGTYIIGSNATGVFAFRNNVWSTITLTFQATSFVQYKDKIWLVPKPGSANPGGSWDGGVFVAIAAIPKGEACTIYKERMYIVPGFGSTVNSSRLSFSAIADPATWNAADFFDVSPGDGDKLIDLVIFNNNLLMFKTDATYALSYDTKPADAVITKISNKIGATGPRCVVVKDDQIYVYHEGDVFQLINYNWTRINVKVPFTYNASAPSTRAENIFMCTMGNRLVVRYFNSIYVFNLFTRTWTRWASNDPDLHNFGPLVAFPSDAQQNVNDLYYAGSSILSNEKMYAINDGWDNATIEKNGATPVAITCSIVTKNYDMNLPYKFKRLYWWGLQAVTNKQVTGIATPVVLGFQATWGDLLSYTWDSLGTWDSPFATLSVATTTPNTASGNLRRYFKFLKAMRYRQINFQVHLTSDGSLNDGPAKIYTLTIFTQTTETVGAAVT